MNVAETSNITRSRRGKVRCAKDEGDLLGGSFEYAGKQNISLITEHYPPR